MISAPRNFLSRCGSAWRHASSRLWPLNSLASFSCSSRLGATSANPIETIISATSSVELGWYRYRSRKFSEKTVLFTCLELPAAASVIRKPGSGTVINRFSGRFWCVMLKILKCRSLVKNTGTYSIFYTTRRVSDILKYPRHFHASFRET